MKGSLDISGHLSMKIILVETNLVCTFFGNIFFYLNALSTIFIKWLNRLKHFGFGRFVGLALKGLIMVRTLENNYFLVRTELGYLR